MLLSVEIDRPTLPPTGLSQLLTFKWARRSAAEAAPRVLAVAAWSLFPTLCGHLCINTLA
jgi:hypothetical protein